jgi:anhydro-N-acetylmuramic acid kinase
MHKNIEKLYSIAQKHKRNIIGLMSGTSVDGLDVALCTLTGNGLDTKIEIIRFETVPYNQTYRENVASIFSKQQVNLEDVCLINEWIGIEHGTIINNCLQQWNIDKTEIDIIASHGQTIYHAPKRMHQKEQFSNATLQIGDGDHIAVTTGIITISDFRQKHIAAGGEGAPLAVYGDYFIFGKLGENRIMLNIGGIANFTYLPANMKIDEIFSTDIGPGNTIMDAYCKQFFNCNYDADAAIALKGIVNEALLEALLKNDFLNAEFPKTTGPELFNLHYLTNAQEQSNTTTISNVDVMATLNKFSAICIANAVQKSIPNQSNYVIYSSGGGMHNPLLMQHLNILLPNATFLTTSDLNINPDAKEAVLFAILANETLVGSNTINSSKKEIPNVSMGKISFPN